MHCAWLQDLSPGCRSNQGAHSLKAQRRRTSEHPFRDSLTRARSNNSERARARHCLRAQQRKRSTAAAGARLVLLKRPLKQRHFKRCTEQERGRAWYCSSTPCSCAACASARPFHAACSVRRCDLKRAPSRAFMPFTARTMTAFTSSSTVSTALPKLVWLRVLASPECVGAPPRELASCRCGAAAASRALCRIIACSARPQSGTRIRA